MSVKSLLLILSVIIVYGTLSACQLGVDRGDGDSITIFSERHYEADRMIYEKFEAETGIKVNLVRDSADPLLVRLENEGEATIADLLVIADAGGLVRAKERDLLQPIDSPFLESVVPEHLRDTDNYWFGLTKRARVIVYHPDRVDVSELSTYEALTEPYWRGRVVTRQASNIYNQSLMAALLEAIGEEAASDFAEGLVANFAETPSGNDRAQANKVLQGIADVAIMNTYYFGIMLNSGEDWQVQAANELEIFFPNQETTGTHINASAIGVTKHAKNPEAAQQFIEFLLSEEIQEFIINNTFEYPINPSVELPELLKSWGQFNEMTVNLEALGKNNNRAKEIMDQVGWDN